MVPAGYLLKRTQRPPEWLKVPHVSDVCSVSSCVTDDVVNIETVWEHNAFGVANDADLLWRLAAEGNIDTSDAQLFFYEAYEYEIESEDWLENPPPWRPFTPIPSGRGEPTAIKIPENKILMGYDVVVCEDYLEHSPLACNHIAETVLVNAHCLFQTLSEAKQAIEGGYFNDCEPGVYKIYSVYRVPNE